MKKIYEGECIVCGAPFKSPSNRRKYCDKHVNNGAREFARMQKKQEYDLAYRNNHKIATYICELCGREHKVERYLLPKLVISKDSKACWDGKTHFYCCIEHMEQARHDHTTCSNCGILLKGSTYRYNMHSAFNYCSAECDKEYHEWLEKQKLNEFVCENCGKTFYRNVQKAYFCCTECHREAVKKGWKSPKQIEAEKHKVEVKYKCLVCGKEFKEEYKDSKYAITHRLIYPTCSKECEMQFRKKCQEEYKEQQRQKRIDKELEKKKAKEPKKGEQLCTTCKVSYRDCERMRSNFRVLPEGAKYNNKGVLTVCPKYKN